MLTRFWLILFWLLLLLPTHAHGFLVPRTGESHCRRQVLPAAVKESERWRDGEESASTSNPPKTSTVMIPRRQFVPSQFFIVLGGAAAAASVVQPYDSARATTSTTKHGLTGVTDPNTYSALFYVNPTTIKANNNKKLPLLVVLHGAGKNEEGVLSLADIHGEHAGLIPSLIASGKAPLELLDNFCVVAPYAAGKRSFYEEPRSKLLQFVNWICSNSSEYSQCIDPNRIFLFGFSDGATVAVELATTRRFQACVICAYGFSGILPSLALERLKDIPFWIFHSADDVIFPVRYSDQLVQSLQSVSSEGTTMIRYTRYDNDQEGFAGSVRGHSVGITASKLPDIYTWMLTTSS